MIIIKLKDQLGNQMFAYAAAKTLSMKKNLPLGIQIENSYYVNSVDEKYGHTIVSIFDNLQNEYVEEIPANYKIYKELPLKKRKNQYWKDIEQVCDNTIIDGHFLSYKYFDAYIAEIKQILSLPFEIKESGKNNINAIKNTDKRIKTTCSVHFRVGDDYKKLGYLMGYSYWEKAANYIRNYDSTCRFIVFYDKKTSYVEKFINEFDAYELHGSLLNDMASIQATDYHIVCNSTYSIMSALLSENNKVIIRPEKYYCGIRLLPDDVYPENWVKCKTHRSLLSFVSGTIYTIYWGIKKFFTK